MADNSSMAKPSASANPLVVVIEGKGGPTSPRHYISSGTILTILTLPLNGPLPSI